MIWTEDGVQGASRFVQRIWRLVNEIATLAGPAVDPPDTFGELSFTLRRMTHKSLHAVEVDLERLAFNRCVAHIYTLTNQISKTIDVMTTDQPDHDMRFALREAGHVLVQLVAPMMPHLGEECWSALGNNGMVAAATWPLVDKQLLIEDTIVLPVQINGKKRGDVTVPADADNATVEALVRSLDVVVRAMEGRDIKKLIVVPRRIVNVVG